MFDQAPKKHNHRVALYGMGGIGKTQTALEYVYTNRDSYERIYWITAVDQASLLSGYLKIAIKAGLKTSAQSEACRDSGGRVILAPSGTKLADSH